MHRFYAISILCALEAALLLPTAVATAAGSPERVHATFVTAARPGMQLVGPLGTARSPKPALQATQSHLASLRAGEGAGPDWCSQNGGETLGAKFRNVYACGPSTGTADVFDTVGFQCVELSARFIWAKYNLLVQNIADGKDLVADAHAQLGTPVGVPGPDSIPAPGDVVSMWGSVQAQPDGHTAVVTAVNVDPLGTGTITIMDENASKSGTDQINVLQWRESYGYEPYDNGYYYYNHITWLKLQPDAAPSSFVYAVRSLGATAADAGSINSAGQVSGRSAMQAVQGKRVHRVFVYSGGKVALLSGPTATQEPIGRVALNDHGAIAVTTSGGGAPSTGYAVSTRSGVRWRALPAGSGHPVTGALGINARGDVSGWVATSHSSTPREGVVWVHARESYRMRALPPNHNFDSPMVYSSDTAGDAVGSEKLGPTKTFAVFWPPAGKAIRLPDLTTPPAYGTAVAMQAHGSGPTRLLSIAGSSRDLNGALQACEWTVKIIDGRFLFSSPQLLAALPGYKSSSAVAVNQEGWIVGSSVTTTGQPIAFLWRPGIGATDLNSLLKPRAGWSVISASALNSSGQIVALGRYKNSKLKRTVLLTPVPVNSN